jgi:hypothetical protein
VGAWVCGWCSQGVKIWRHAEHLHGGLPPRPPSAPLQLTDIEDTLAVVAQLWLVLVIDKGAVLDDGLGAGVVPLRSAVQGGQYRGAIQAVRDRQVSLRMVCQWVRVLYP